MPAEKIYIQYWEPSWSWSYGSWIYNYLFSQCLSPLALWVRILLRQGALDATLCDKVCQWLATGRWFSPDTSVSSTNKTDRHGIAEILLKVTLNTITLTLWTILRLRGYINACDYFLLNILLIYWCLWIGLLSFQRFITVWNMVKIWPNEVVGNIENATVLYIKFTLRHP